MPTSKTGSELFLIVIGAVTFIVLLGGGWWYLAVHMAWWTFIIAYSVFNLAYALISSTVKELRA